MPETCSCGRDIKPPEPSQMITASAGWCAPSETVYDMTDCAPMCSDCKARLLMVIELGIDPGVDGKNLLVARGGIRYA